MERRKFIENIVKSGLLLGAGSSLFKLSYEKKSNQSLNILILGGTSFLGPHQIAYALERGHKITTFTRGKTKSTVHQDLFNQVESLVGDRENDLSALNGRTWDAVIDNSGRKVEWSQKAAELLKDSCDLYLYTSSTGVYYPYLSDNNVETQSCLTQTPSNASGVEKMEYDYGVMKYNSENTVKKIFGTNRTIIVRPTYMMGPGDRTDRFTYWPLRLEKGGDIFVPGKAEDPVQYIDVRDVAKFMIDLIEAKNCSTFNAVGPKSETGMHQFVYGAHAAVTSKANFIFCDDHPFLEKNKIFDSVPWIMPTGNNYGSARASMAHGLKNGLTHRPLSNSVQDIIEWWNSGVIPKDRMNKLLNGKNSLGGREAELIKKWQSNLK